MAKGASSSKAPMNEMEEIMEPTRNISWEDVSGMMKVNNNQVEDFEALMLVGRLASQKALPNLSYSLSSKLDGGLFLIFV